MTSAVSESRDKVGESPVWSVAEQALYWVDIEGRLIRRHDPSSGAVTTWKAPQRPGCIALRKGGGLVAAMETGVFDVDLGEGFDVDTPMSHRTEPAAAPALNTEVETEPDRNARFTLIASASHPAPGMRFNDGRCDANGRLWVGSMVMDMSAASNAGALFRVTRAHGEGRPMVDGLLVSNGLAFSPDNRFMYLSDSHPAVQTIWRFDFDPDSGSVGHRRVFVDMKEHPGRPDGAAMDSEGCYWTCANDAGLIHRFTPDGRLDRSVAVPVSKPSMCAFGGSRLDTLYVTSIQPARPAATHPHEMALAGALFAIDVKARGIEEPMFG